MPQMEQNMYLNALNQAKSDIVHRINMPTIYMYPLLNHLYIFVHWCLLEEEQDVNR